MTARLLPLPRVLTALLGLCLAIVPVGAQQRRRPFRNPRARDRMATTRAAIDSLDQESRALRKVLLDSALGTPMWLEFSAEQQAAEQRAGTVDGVIAHFLARRGTILGLEDRSIKLRQVKRQSNGDMVHVRFREYWRGLPVTGGELRVHLRQTNRGYVLETANGRLYADIEAPEAATLPPSAAMAAASSLLHDTFALDSVADGGLSIMPYASGYRLAYTATGHRLRALVDAQSGEILDTVPSLMFGSAAGTAEARHGHEAPRRSRHTGSPNTSSALPREKASRSAGSGSR